MADKQKKVILSNCKYRIPGTNFEDKTIEDLYRYLDEKSLYNSIEDVIYSQDEIQKQVYQEDTLNKIKDLSVKLSDSLGLDEEGNDIGENSEMSVGYFLDNSEEAKVNGKRVCVPLIIENFKKHRIAQYIKEKLSQQEAELLTQNEIDNWKLIKENSADLHKLVISKYIGGSSESEPERRKKFIDQAKTIVGKNSQLYDDNLLGKLFDGINSIYAKIKGYKSDSKAVRGINVTSKLNFSDTVLFGHIDYAIIDDKGTLHIYNFKASSQHYTNWSDEKKEKYRYELAFIKQMLSNNGLYIDKIQMNIIPIKLEYDKNFKKIQSIKVNPEPIDYQYDKKTNYLLYKHDNNAKYFIKSKSKVQPLKMSDKIEIDDILNAIFPTLQVKADNINKSVQDWIKRAPSQGDEHPLVITEINDGEHRYSVKIDGKVHLISDYTEKSNNKEIIKLVTDYIEYLNEDSPNYVNKIADAIQHTFDRKREFWDFDRIKNSSYLKTVLAPYISGNVLSRNDQGVATDIEYNWEFIDTLVDYGILLFKNKSGQLDTVTLSSKNLNLIPKFNYGTNVLGGYKTDRDFQWKGFWGNIESVRTLINLNHIIDTLPKDTILGTQHIISYQGLGMHMQYNMEHIIKDYLPTILKVTKQYNQDLTIKNNFGQCTFVNQFETLVKQFADIIQQRDSSSILLKELVNVDELKNATTNEQKAKALLSILQSFEEQFPDIANDPLTASGSNDYSGNLAKFYIKASQTYLYYTNQKVSYEEELKSYQRNLYTAPTVPNTNINIVVTNLQTTIDSIANDSDTEYSRNLRSFIMQFYKDAGYTSLENMTLGTQARLFENMYELDSKGQKTMKFKNPYTDSSLKEYERKFLKKALFYFNKYNFLRTDNKHFTSENDPDIPKYILEHNEYLNVPLERASTSTRRQRGVSDRVSRLKRVLKIFFKNKGQDIYDEFVNNLTQEEREFISEGIDSLRMKDSFNRTEAQRIDYIAENGVDYFETNVENLLIDRMFGAIQTEKMNRMLLGTKALLLQLKILGDKSGFDESFNKEEKYIRDYIGLNVFKKPIIESGLSQKVVGLGQAVRSDVTFLNLAGNIIAAARDVENGFMENYLRTCTKYLTDISASNMSKAYAYVVKNGSLDAMKITLLSKLCVRYRLSNTDTARITERLRTNRQGLSNWDNIAYASLRSPDFLNRMTLFIARAMQDGVLDAWSVEDGELKYNWKKDKRFSVFADKSKKGTEEYRKQQSLYMLHIQEWNRDHPEQILNYTDDLPTPYSDQEIVAIKNVSNNIYGSYDKSLRSMGEFTAIGVFFGMYTTWMNGIWNTWMMKPGKYNVHKMTIEQDTDIDGSLLFLDEFGSIYKEIINEDGTKKYINLDTKEEKDIKELAPLLKHVPVIVQGVIYTLGDALKIFHKDGLDAAIEYIKSDVNTVNSLKHALFSSLLAALFALLFKFVLDPAYAETKKGYRDMNMLSIVMSELIYRSFNPATDSFYGPLNIIKYLGEGMDPPIYNVPTKFVSDAWKTAFGNKTVGQFITGNFAFARVMKQAANVQAKYG